MKVPELAPGCFGTALSFDSADMVCKSCPFAAQCEPLHQRSIAALRERLGIVIKQPQRSIPSVATSPDGVETAMWKKTRELIERLDRVSSSIKRDLQHGKNPFGKNFKFLTVTCHLLLKFEAVNHDLITAGCVQFLKCSQASAQNYAHMAIQALTHIGAVVNNDGKISIKRD